MDFFTVSSREKKGILVLISIIVMLNVLMQFPSLFTDGIEANDYSAFETEIIQWENNKKNSHKNDSYFYSGKNREKKKHKLSAKFYFDPNVASEDELKRLGFFPSVAKRLVNFRSKGGKFFTPGDLRKIYGISDDFYTSIEPWIRINSEKLNQTSDISSEIKKEKKPEIININSADTSQLKLLRGIGSVLSSRIIRYRDALGGFNSIEQLKEVYGMKEEILENISSLILIAGEIKTININTCTFDDLKKHPYIKPKIASGIVNYREKHGPYLSVEEIRKTDLVDEELYRKIAPYLSN